MEEQFQSVGARISELRGGLTQAQFAARLGVDRKTVVRWEAGERLPDGSSLLRFVQEFSADINYILTGQRSTSASVSVLTAQERMLLDNYRNTHPAQQQFIEQAAVMASQREAAKGGSKR